jgi:hypothetical protein
MSDDAAPPELAHALDCSLDFFGALAEALDESVEIASRRSLLAQGTASAALEHGFSIVTLVQGGQLASASVLLRAQFEAVVRALWLHYCADDAWIEKYFAAVKANPTKDPGLSRGMDDMLADIAARAPAALANMLKPLKQGAWGPLNSYVHSGIHAVVHQHAGPTTDFALSTLRNGNGLAGMAATLSAIMTGDNEMMRAVVAAQHAHLDCLPPLETPPLQTLR